MTFLLTDVEGSTRLWEEHADVMGAALERHDDLIAQAVEGRGTLIRSKGEGDSTFSVFGSPAEAITAAVDTQLALRREPWPEGVEIRVRAALYTGDAELRDGDYFGTAPNRAARLRGIAHGGQTICSSATAEFLRGRTPPDVALLDLGLHRLRDLAGAERVFQVSHRDLAGDFPPLRSLGVRHNLPEQRTRFVGRTDDLLGIEKHLDTARLVTITGIGGCGKTRLAVEVARELLEGYPDGVFFVDLAPVSDPHVVAGTVASAVGFSQIALGTGSGRPGSELIDFLSTREVLIVIDNCEHVVDACAQLVDEMLERCPEVWVLATSREPLQLQGEQTYPLAPMAVPEDEFPELSDSVRLFVDRAGSARPDFALTPETSGDVVEICRRLDGLPLAIELAAAHVSHLSPRQIVERLDDRFQLLTGSKRRTRRQQTLHAALDWSHELLSEHERTVFRRLASFPGNFSLDAAEAVSGNGPVFDVVGSLVEKSLVVTEVDGADLRYRLLETVRVYAEQKLIEAGEDADVRDRHRDYFLGWVESIPPELTYLDPHGQIKGERHNLRASLRWSEQQGRADLIGRIASTMNALWVADIREGRRWLEFGVEAVEELDPDYRTRVLTEAALVAVMAIEARDGELARRAVEASEGRSGMWSSLAHSLLCLNAGIRFMFSRNPVFADEVEDLGYKAVQLAPEATSRQLAWFFLGQARVLLDDFDGATEGLRQGSVESTPGGDMSVVCLAMLAGVYHITGRHDEARETANEVRERTLSQTTGAMWAWALYCLLPYALELGHEGRHDEAVDFLREILEEGATPRTPGVMNSVVVVLAALALRRGDEEVGALLLEYVGQAVLRDGVRTPIDIALYSHYLWKVRRPVDDETADRHRELVASMSLDDALAMGLRMA
ncbi:MAG: ATP-binding protein [Actinomycetota bacterium]